MSTRGILSDRVTPGACVVEALLTKIAVFIRIVASRTGGKERESRVTTASSVAFGVRIDSGRVSIKEGY